MQKKYTHQRKKDYLQKNCKQKDRNCNIPIPTYWATVKPFTSSGYANKILASSWTTSLTAMCATFR